jgi:hypothetical protein
MGEKKKRVLFVYFKHKQHNAWHKVQVQTINTEGFLYVSGSTRTYNNFIVNIFKEKSI